MKSGLSATSLVPAGLLVTEIRTTEDAILVTARAEAPSASCPACGSASRRIHSHYIRRVSDLPCSGRALRLHVVARRFRCDTPTCRQRIFAERFPAGVLPAMARRTTRLECLVHHLGLVLGGRPAACFARRLMLPVSNDTLLRVVRRRARVPAEALRVVGIDDWAFRRNYRYGTIVCDLERRRIVSLLPDREPATVRAWLSEHPGIEILSRDRGGGYGEAVSRALPNTIQVADRWHLMENASAAFLDAVRRSMRLIRSAIGATRIEASLLTAAERLQFEGYLRREEANAAVTAMAKEGASIKQIVRCTGHSRGLVRRIIRGSRSDVFRARQNSLDRYLPLLDAKWEAGCRNGAELWRRLGNEGFRGSLRVVTEWATRRRRSEQTSDPQLRKVPSARMIARLMTIARDHLGKADTVIVAAIQGGVPGLIEARDLVDRFHTMIRKKIDADLDRWIDDARTGLIASFVNGIRRDRASIQAALVHPWSNGQTEGQITKLKLVKRQMYGRAKIDLLQARLIGAA